MTREARAEWIRERAAYLFAGCVVYALVDRDGELLEWLDSAPRHVRGACGAIFFFGWPYVAASYWFGRRR